MPGGLFKILNGEYVEVFCEYSKNGICSACDQLSIACNGERFWLCEQRKITRSDDSDKELTEMQKYDADPLGE